MSLRIGIAGAAGRMGRLVAEEVRAAGQQVAGGTLRPGGAGSLPDFVPPCTDIAELAAASDVVIDFTSPSTVIAHARVLAQAGVPWVLGTTGLVAAEEAAVAAAAQRIAVNYAPNYAPGVTLMLVLAEQMAAALPAAQYDAEIMEMHHRQKLDAPSGTALGLGRAVAAGRGGDFAALRTPAREGHGGARPTGAIGFAALRGGQVVGEHTLIFAGGAEHLTLSHRAFDRRVFATGAVQAALWVAGRPPGLSDMRDVMGLRPPA